MNYKWWMDLFSLCSFDFVKPSPNSCCWMLETMIELIFMHWSANCHRKCIWFQKYLHGFRIFHHRQNVKNIFVFPMKYFENQPEGILVPIDPQPAAVTWMTFAHFSGSDLIWVLCNTASFLSWQHTGAISHANPAYKMMHPMTIHIRMKYRILRQSHVDLFGLLLVKMRLHFDLVYRD